MILPSTSTLGESRGRENQNNEIKLANNEDENIKNNEQENSVPSTSKDNLKVVRKFERKKSPINRYGNPITNCIYVNYVSVDNPESYNEAISSNECEKWQEAMNNEIDC